MIETLTNIETFIKDVDEGLSANKKFLSSKYFYDKKGDELFVKIMNMPEYYLADAELEIMNEQTRKLISSFGMNGKYFEIIELGAGDGQKVINLLKQLSGSNFTYAPVDISYNAIQKLEDRLIKEIPWLNINGKQGEYFEVLRSLKHIEKKVILFLGSNIGNLSDSLAHDFMLKIGESMTSNDKLLIGFDLKKDPDLIKLAYDDPHGYTREFNLNLLKRINNELGGDFDIGHFRHLPEYDAENGMALSYLESTTDQVVNIEATGKAYHFTKGERIHTEISRKYDLNTIKEITKDTGLIVKKTFYDSRKYYVDVLFEKDFENHLTD
jgi:L-histidine N-alpha-methyltransferase